MARYGWTLWGMIQDGTSAIEFDFWEWSMTKLEPAERLARSPRFERPPRPRGIAMSAPAAGPLPSRARVVVVGGGIVGASTAYHLAHLGETDVLLLEQGTLSCGTTWHAAGLVGLLRASESGTRLVQYSAELYQRLEAETGLGTGYRPCGGLIVARTDDRMTALRAHRRDGRRLRPRLRAAHPGAGRRALPAAAHRRPRRGDLAAR